MKFLETENGAIINIDEISHFDFSSYGQFLDYRVVLKCGSMFSLIETPDSFEFNGKSVEFNLDHLISYGKACVLALPELYKNNDYFITNDQLCNIGWELFLKGYEEHIASTQKT